jgi:hypothetical protein
MVPFVVNAGRESVSILGTFPGTGVGKVSSSPALQQLLQAGNIDSAFAFDEDERPSDALWPAEGESATFGMGLDEDEIGLDVDGAQPEGFVQHAMKTDLVPEDDDENYGQRFVLTRGIAVAPGYRHQPVAV